MDLAIKILLGVLCLPLVALGIRSMFKPTGMLDDLAVQANGSAGLNTVRGVVGGLFLASAAMIVLGLATEQTVWLLAVALLMGVAAIGRVVGIAADGYDKAVLRPLVAEVVISAVAVLAHIRFGVA